FDNTHRKEEYQVKGEIKGKFKFKKSANIPTTSGFLTTKDRSCIFCNRAHESKNCYDARLLSLEEKISKIKEKKCCLKCLEPNHVAKFCKEFIRCYICGKSHVISLCPEIRSKNETPMGKQSTENVQIATARQTCTSEVALMTLQVKVAGVNKNKKIRALLDCGSQKSYISKSVAAELGLSAISKETVAHTLFGGARTEPKLHNKYHVKLCSLSQYEHPDLEFDFLDQDVICGDIPRISKGPILKELKRNKIWLSDIGSDCPKIDMLIGSDIYGKILTGLVKQLKGGLTAVNTKLGWVVCGKFDDFPIQNDQSASILCAGLAVRDYNISDLWNLETIGILDAQHNLTKAAEEEIAHEQFLNSLNRNEEGRYCVGLPWLGNDQQLPDNRFVAERRLFSVTRKLNSLNKYGDYDQVFRDWIGEGVIEMVPDNELNFKGHYLPHHPVFKPDSATTKIRPVFDASCKVNRSPSLNDCLFKGPNLIEEIPSILLRFREKCIGVTSDIRRAFLQIELKKEDRDFLRFLWWEKDNVVKVFRHNRVVFGVTSSPFLLGAVIRFHLSQVPTEQRVIAQKLDRSFYIDNCVTSVDNEEELENFIKYSTEILAEAKMDLRLWTFGPIEYHTVLSTDFTTESTFENPVPVLGIIWDRKDDNLSISIKDVSVSERLSKREILSVTQAIFDPLGFLAPVLLPAKLLLQQIWEIKSDWDTPLPEEIKVKFLKWFENLQILTDLKIPRRIGFGDKRSWSLHVFCDSSQQAYATVIFLRCEYDGKIFVSFVSAKSRVAPLKKLTIPRLELMACVLGVRLSNYLTEALSLSDIPKYFWTDSTTALFWIKRNDQWGTFVGNRVREICSVTKWEGPVWLKGPPNSWPKSEIKPDEALISSERRKGTNLSVQINSNAYPNESKWYKRFSNFTKIVRVLGWVKRFIRNCQNLFVNKEPFLSTDELRESKNTLFSLVQGESFPESGNSVNGILVERDQRGLLRVKTKIIERDDDYAFRYTILLPSKHHVVDCLIREYHLKHSHAGIQTLLAIIREEFWIIAARRTIRSVVKKCVRCKRFTAKPPTTFPIQLPLDRIRDAATFEVTGIDLCGPLILRSRTKAWVVLFTCAVYRCVHLEVVTSINTEYFIQALRRFIARRGRPSVIYTDNGTNFTGTSTLLRKVDWEKVVSQETLNPINWKFIPPTAAWWGGWWERLIRTTKNLLVRVLGQASVNYEELLTILCDIESVVNCRPLTYISNDSEDLLPLTPSMFLQDIKESGVADLDLLDRSKLLKRQRFLQELREQFRCRFRKEYLAQLVQRHGQKDCELKVGDIVLVGSDNLKRINWPIARVEELCTGRDGRARVVKIKTRTGILVRPVRKLYPLEVCSCNQDSTI
ncbi:hypothetical protein AVEN_6294-1, partial [Araneus ventricosus]